jgi:hypothetical protein
MSAMRSPVRASSEVALGPVDRRGRVEPYLGVAHERDDLGGLGYIPEVSLDPLESCALSWPLAMKDPETPPQRMDRLR